MTESAQTLWMTQTAFDRLEQELAELSAADRDVTDAEQARVLELRDMIRRAEVGTKPDDGVVEAGMRVRVRFESDGSTEEFLLGSRDVVGGADDDIDVYSPTSPLGTAISGRSVGDTAEFTAPSGATIAVTVLEAVPFA